MGVWNHFHPLYLLYKTFDIKRELDVPEVTLTNCFLKVENEEFLTDLFFTLTVFCNIFQKIPMKQEFLKTGKSNNKQKEETKIPFDSRIRSVS